MLSVICGVKNKYILKKTDSQIKLVVPVVGGNGKGQDRGMGLRGINHYVWKR